MSFDFNSIGPNNFKPKVEGTLLGKGGGGGNTGYFQQERKNKDEEDKPVMSYLTEDKLEKMADQGIEEAEKQKDGLLDKFKNFLGKLG